MAAAVQPPKASAGVSPRGSRARTQPTEIVSRSSRRQLGGVSEFSAIPQEAARLPRGPASGRREKSPRSSRPVMRWPRAMPAAPAGAGSRRIAVPSRIRSLTRCSRIPSRQATRTPAKRRTGPEPRRRSGASAPSGEAGSARASSSLAGPPEGRGGGTFRRLLGSRSGDRPGSQRLAGLSAIPRDAPVDRWSCHDPRRQREGLRARFRRTVVAGPISGDRVSTRRQLRCRPGPGHSISGAAGDEIH